MGNLLIFEDRVSCSPYVSEQGQLFPVYLVEPGTVGLVSEDFPGEWVVLVGNTLLIVSKNAPVNMVT